MKNYRYKVWFKSNKPCIKCGSNKTYTKQWIQYKPEYEQQLMMRCDDCGLREIIKKESVEDTTKTKLKKYETKTNIKKSIR